VSTPQVATGEGAGTRDPARIEAEIERTREELADTVAAVAEKADVKKQVRLKVDEAKARIPTRQIAIGLAVAGVAVAALLVRRTVRRRVES
jgi:hypothetical protein